jgi:hypothetical protein
VGECDWWCGLLLGCVVRWRECVVGRRFDFCCVFAVGCVCADVGGCVGVRAGRGLQTTSTQDLATVPLCGLLGGGPGSVPDEEEVGEEGVGSPVVSLLEMEGLGGCV